MSEQVSGFWYWIMAGCTLFVFSTLYVVAMALTAKYWKPEAIFFAASVGGYLVGVYCGWRLYKAVNGNNSPARPE